MSVVAYNEDQAKALAHWAEWVTLCAWERCGAASQAYLQTYAQRHAQAKLVGGRAGGENDQVLSWRLANHLRPLMNRPDFAIRVLEAQIHGRKAKNAEEAKPVKSWVKDKLANAKSDPVGECEAYLSTVMKTAMEKLAKGEAPKKWQVAVTVINEQGQVVNAVELWEDPSAGPAELLARQDQLTVARRVAREFVATLEPRQRLVLTAVGLRWGLNDPALLARLGLKRQACYDLHDKAKAALKDYLRRHWASEIHNLSSLAPECWMQSCLYLVGCAEAPEHPDHAFFFPQTTADYAR